MLSFSLLFRSYTDLLAAVTLIQAETNIHLTATPRVLDLNITMDTHKVL